MTSGGLKPNNSPRMELGERRLFLFDLANDVGTSTISSVAMSGARLTIEPPEIAGRTVTAMVAPQHAGTHTLTLVAELSSGETIKKVLTVHSHDSEGYSRTRDY